MWLEVTQDDIARGKRNSPLRGPVALALARVLPARQVRASIEGLCVCRPNGWWEIVSPPEPVRDFIRRFDAGLPCGPRTFGVPVEPEGVSP
jgi:hypothetical protein